MKTAIAIVAGLMSFGIVGISPAAAYHLTPENTSFSGSGNTSATKSGITLKCTAKFTGKVSSTGVGSVTGGSFSGEIGCSGVTLGNLPWPATAVSATTVDIKNVTFQSIIGNCGPSTLKTTLKNGVISFTNAKLSGGCTASGSITTSPKLAISK
jgi:hypothetical protein